MITTVGILICALGLFAWAGQTISFFWPSVAVRLGILEPEADLDPTLRIIEAKAEGFMDFLLAWTLPAAALLMILDHPLWPYLGLFGGGVFAYFSGLIMVTRPFLKGEGKKVGNRASELAAYLFGALWMASAMIMIGLSAYHFSR
jgi:hypothetical protein